MPRLSAPNRYVLRTLAIGISLLAALGAAPASAQLPTGAISGRVLDSSGAAIPSATVTTTSRETGRVQSTESSAGGYYKILLPVGVYDVKVEATSFQREIRQGLQLEIGRASCRERV